MARKIWRSGLACGLAALLSGAACAVAMAQSAPLPAEAIRAVEQDTGDFLIRLKGAVDSAENVETLPRSDYWIGIAIGSLPDVAKAQLQIEHGLVVAEVMEGSPAAKAEFKTHDIMLKAGGAKLESAADLIKAVEAAKESTLSVVLLRGGKEQTIDVTPIKRPKTESVALGSESGLVAPIASPDVRVEIKKLEEALSKLKEKAGDSPLGIVLARPGVVPHINVFRANDFPKSLSITISKTGSEPAKIHVKKDDKEWDVTEGKLSELPGDVRVHVENFFARPQVFTYPTPPATGGGQNQTMRLYAPGLPGVGGAGGTPATAPRATRAYAVPVPATPATPVAPPAPRAQAFRIETSGAVDTKLDAIMKKLEALDRGSLEQLQSEVKQLRKELDELRGKSKSERDE